MSIPEHSRAVQVTSHGGPEVNAIATVPTPAPKPGEALVRVRFAGVNFIDNYQRTGLYPGETPYVPGMEGAGEVGARPTWPSATRSRGRGCAGASPNTPRCRPPSS